jgi:hypothetical protein
VEHEAYISVDYSRRVILSCYCVVGRGSILELGVCLLCLHTIEALSGITRQGYK